MGSRPARHRYCRCGTHLAADNNELQCARCQQTSRDKLIAPPRVPAEFWRHEQLREAFAAQHLGRVARAYRTHPHHHAIYGPSGISQPLLGHWLGLRQPQISRIETGLPIRDLDTLVYWARILRIPTELLWFDLPGQTRQVAQNMHNDLAVPVPATTVEGAWNAKPAGSCPTVSSSNGLFEEPAKIAERHAELRVSSLTGELMGPMPQLMDPESADIVEPWELADALTRSMIDMTTLEHMERAVLGYVARYPCTTPVTLLPAITGQTRRLREVLNNPQRLRVRQRSVVLLGVLAGLAGNLWLDLGEDDRAAGFFDVGELAGQEAQDADLTAWVLATRSLGPFFAGQFVDAADLLVRAEVAADAGSGTRRQAWVAALRSRAAAATGDHRGSLEALERAYRLMDTVSEPPRGTEFFDPPRLDGMAGTAYRLLRDTDRAVPLLRQALDHRAPTDAKGKALVLLDLADCHVVTGEPEEGARTVVEALDIANSALVQPILTRTRALRSVLSRWAGTRAVADLDARLRDIIPIANVNRRG
ncbi:MAG: hypothetical protein ACRDRS_10805 [Pseudonocardiaceae bacterium]